MAKISVEDIRESELPKQTDKLLAELSDLEMNAITGGNSVPTKYRKRTTPPTMEQLGRAIQMQEE